MISMSMSNKPQQKCAHGALSWLKFALYTPLPTPYTPGFSVRGWRLLAVVSVFVGVGVGVGVGS
jgi:hypothetical protein